MSCITGVGALSGDRLTRESLETMIFVAATTALADAGLERNDLDGVVIAGSDLVDGRAITSMLTAAHAGALLKDEINIASSPGHALCMAHLMIASGSHRRLLVASWGKASESEENNTETAERLSAEPFFDRDIGLGPLAAAAMQAAQRRDGSDTATAAALAVAARSHGFASTEAVARSTRLAFPLRELEWRREIDGAFALVVEAGIRPDVQAAAIEGVWWCSDSNRLAERDLTELPHLRIGAARVFKQAGIAKPIEEIDTWHLHDYSSDSEILAYEALSLCGAGGGNELALSGETAAEGLCPVNPEGGSLAGEAPFGGPLQKVVAAANNVRTSGAPNRHRSGRELVQITSGFAGQFQTVCVIGAHT